MSKKSAIFSATKSQINIIYFACLVITLYFNTRFTDSFNAAKLLVLILFSAWISGYLLHSGERKNINSAKIKKIKLVYVLVFAYLFFLLLSTVFAYNTSVAFFGESFRRNGFITYAALSVFFLATVKFTTFQNIKDGFKFINITSVVVVLYAYIQIFGKDPVSWSSTNQVISTLGNTNFAGALMAIFALVIFGQIFFYNYKGFIKGSLIIFLSLILYAIIKTNARQALILVVFGIGLFLILSIRRSYRLIRIILSFVYGSVLIIALLGAFNFGPLRSIIYKDSISVRGFYWRAGIKMFENFPFFGVGLDNYNYYFKELREVNYPLRYGWNLTSSNAHNLVIQNFATGGFFVGSTYIALQIFILINALQLIRNATPLHKIPSITLVVAWLAYQLQSLVSIDNIGLAIWGNVLGGSIVGLRLNAHDQNESRSNFSRPKSEVSRILKSSAIFGISLILVIPLYQIDRNTWLAKSLVAPGNSQAESQFNEISRKVLNSKFVVPDYKNIVIGAMVDMNDLKGAKLELENLLKSDPRNLDALTQLAFINEKTSNFPAAIQSRLKIANLDPWNAQNYLGLAQLYRQIGNIEQMRFYANKILSFASKDPIAEVTKKEFLNGQAK